jgi:hypothetical protein
MTYSTTDNRCQAKYAIRILSEEIKMEAVEDKLRCCVILSPETYVPIEINRNTRKLLTARSFTACNPLT